MSPKVSVIIPAYNAAATLPRMLDAIKAQTFENFEVVVINDGSKDDTQSVLEQYQSEDSRIRVFRQENQGVSAARNYGLDVARGDYIAFFDADDEVPENALNDLYHAAREHMADLVIGRHTIQYMTEDYMPKSSRSLSNETDIPKYHKSLCWNFTLCNKLFRRSLIEEFQLRFNGTKHAEDGLFIFRYIQKAEKITGCPSIVYKYVKNSFWEDASLSQKANSSSFKDLRRNLMEIIQVIDEESAESLNEVNASDATQAAKDEMFWNWKLIRSTMWKRFAQISILDEYYRLLWNSDEELYSLLQKSLEECRENMFPSQWKALLEDNSDLQMDVGLMNREELAENPLLSVLVTAELPKESVEKMLEAYYGQIFVSFEILLDEALIDAVPKIYLKKENFHVRPHANLAKWKKAALQEAKGTHCIIVEEPVYPSTRTVAQMMKQIHDKTFITAPICKIDGECFHKLETQSTVFTNEFSVIKKRSKYNQLDAIWSNKIFSIKNLLAKKRLFESDSTKDLNRLYGNSSYIKFEDNSFVTNMSDSDVLRKVKNVGVKLGYARKLRKEEKRLNRIEKESTEVETISLRLKKWRNRKLREGYKFLTLKVLFPIYYKWHARKPIEKNKVLFIVNRKPTLPNSMTYVHNLLEKSGKFNIHDKFLLNLSLRYRQKFKVDLDLIKDLATANYVFLDEATVTTCGINKRPETKIVQLWHGCGAFKKFGFSTADKIFGGNAKEQKRYPMYRNFDLVCVSSPEVVWAYEEAMQLKGVGNVKPVGVSRTDVFFQDDYIRAAKQRIIEQIPAAAEKKIILYAPTFRGRVASAYGPDHFDYEKLYESLGAEYIILIKHHPLVKRLPEIPLEYRDSFVYDVSHTMEIEDLICASDICISDYSSLIFEYSLFEKPIILFAYDLDVYFDWRGFYYDYFEMAPGPVLISTEEIIDYITHIDTEFDREKMHAFREKFMRSCDGHSTDRILDEVGLKL